MYTMPILIIDFPRFILFCTESKQHKLDWPTLVVTGPTLIITGLGTGLRPVTHELVIGLSSFQDPDWPKTDKTCLRLVCGFSMTHLR